jgi:hypothetical protein
MIGFLLGCLVGYAVMWVRHGLRMREINKQLEIMLAVLKVHRMDLPMPNAGGEGRESAKRTSPPPCSPVNP